jgi:hypothetical protein
MSDIKSMGLYRSLDGSTSQGFAPVVFVKRKNLAFILDLVFCLHGICFHSPENIVHCCSSFCQKSKFREKIIKIYFCSFSFLRYLSVDRLKLRHLYEYSETF